MSAREYILATGAPEVERLRILNDLYGPASEALLRRAGLAPGAHVVELGCGDGNMSRWLAAEVGPEGRVLGIDASAAQVDEARRLATERGLTNLTFAVGDVLAPELAAGGFDFAYCRLVLMHVADPVRALGTMRDLVVPGGRVVVEEMDLGHWICDPASDLVARFFELNLALGARHGGDFRLGTHLHRLFREAGLANVDVSVSFPTRVRGEGKRVLLLSFQQMAPALAREGLATDAELQAIEQELARIAADDTTLLGLPLVGQAWAPRARS